MVPQRPFFNGQSGLGAVMRLNLALLVHRQHGRHAPAGST
jgi:hypothetical protein